MSTSALHVLQALQGPPQDGPIPYVPSIPMVKLLGNDASHHAHHDHDHFHDIDDDHDHVEHDAVPVLPNVINSPHVHNDEEKIHEGDNLLQSLPGGPVETISLIDIHDMHHQAVLPGGPAVPEKVASIHGNYSACVNSTKEVFSVWGQHHFPSTGLCGSWCEGEDRKIGDWKIFIVEGYATTTPMCYGHNPYSADSFIDEAAVAAGLMNDGETAAIKVKCTAKPDTYGESSANGGACSGHEVFEKEGTSADYEFAVTLELAQPGEPAEGHDAPSVAPIMGVPMMPEPLLESNATPNASSTPVSMAKGSENGPSEIVTPTGDALSGVATRASPADDSGDASTPKTSAIVGIVVGVLGVLALVVGAVLKARKTSARSASTGFAGINMNDPVNFDSLAEDAEEQAGEVEGVLSVEAATAAADEKDSDSEDFPPEDGAAEDAAAEPTVDPIGPREVMPLEEAEV